MKTNKLGILVYVYVCCCERYVTMVTLLVVAYKGKLLVCVFAYELE